VEKYKDSYRYEQLKALMVRNEKPNVAAIFKQILRENTTRVKTLWDIAEIRTKKVKAEIIWDDARSIKKGSYTIKGLINKSHFEELNNSISCIITSPPYLAAQKYVRSTKLELFWLGMASDSDINKLDRDTIGHERISLRYNKHDFDITFVDTLLEKIENKSKERMLIVSEYLRNMVEVFRNCHKLLVNDGVMVIVVGNNKISNMTINTMKLLTILAKKCGFKDTLVLYDEIKGRGMITKRHYTGGLIKNEFLIVLRKSDNGT
jgi:adenine-specific DNA methylase